MDGMGGKGYGYMYESVSKSEYASVQSELEKIIEHFRGEISRRYSLTFEVELVGSAKKKLITRIKGGNRGYDFDYNIVIPAPAARFPHFIQNIKPDCMRAFKSSLGGTGFSDPENSTSAITIKKVDQKRSKIRCSCDFAIIYYDYDRHGAKVGYHYLKYHKKQNTYEFVFRPPESNINEKERKIRKNGGSEVFRKEYLKLKNKNARKKKPSHSIYKEAVNNVYNQMFLQ